MRYRLLGRTGLRVSQLCLGTMNFGGSGGDGIDAAGSAQVFNAFVEAGGTFIDTADTYVGGEGERILSDLIAKDRDHLVLASKFSQVAGHRSVTRAGNSRKAMHRAVEASLRRLKTDYIDVLYLHLWDGTTPVDEIMQAFDDLVRAGKVLYPGMSNIPAWVVARAQTMAELRGWARIAALQIQYSLATRVPDRDLVPMANSLGIAVTAWGPLASGVLSGKYRPGVDTKTHRNAPIDPELSRIAAVVRGVAERCGALPAQVALAWLVQQDVIPVVGARDVEQVAQNVAALDVVLPDDAMTELSAATAPALGYPHELFPLPFMNPQIYAGTRDRLKMRPGVTS
jgi:aryl-alcohol dehydrogenase-like predicted oxidoreductase